VRYCSCCGVVRCENAVVTAALVRGSWTLKSGVSLRIRVPARMMEVAKHPRPSPGDSRTVYRLFIVVVDG
jgi:hypothetical protein